MVWGRGMNGYRTLGREAPGGGGEGEGMDAGDQELTEAMDRLATTTGIAFPGNPNMVDALDRQMILAMASDDADAIGQSAQMGEPYLHNTAIQLLRATYERNPSAQGFLEHLASMGAGVYQEVTGRELASEGWWMALHAPVSVTPHIDQKPIDTALVPLPVPPISSNPLDHLLTIYDPPGTFDLPNIPTLHPPATDTTPYSVTRTDTTGTVGPPPIYSAAGSSSVGPPPPQTTQPGPVQSSLPTLVQRLTDSFAPPAMERAAPESGGVPGGAFAFLTRPIAGVPTWGWLAGVAVVIALRKGGKPRGHRNWE